MRSKLLRMIVLLALVLVAPTLVLCEEKKESEPRLRLFAGYGLVRSEAGRNIVDVDRNIFTRIVGPGNFQGLIGSFGVRMFQGVTVKFEYGNLNAPANVQMYLAGPEARLIKLKRLEIFGHILGGAVRSEATIGLQTKVGSVRIEDTVWAFVIGGGTDIVISRNVVARVFQADYLDAPISGTGGTSNLRIASGVMIRW